jgi:pimeloyl-ACP methyl ester carboxylesterase
VFDIEGTGETLEPDPTRNRKRRADSHRLVRVDDIDIACRVRGEGEPLVMISAYAITMGTWDKNFIERLASSYTVITFDNRGMGHTTSGTAPWSIDRFAADTAGLIRALGFDMAHVLGWSLGGDVALGLAVEFPETVERLIVYAGDCGGPQKVPAPKYLGVLKEAFRGRYVPFEGALAILFPPKWMKSHWGYWRRIPFPRELVKPKSIVKQNKAYEEWAGVYEQLPGIDCPALIVTGEEDVSTPPENADILHERIPGSTLVRFPGAGHGLMYQYPDALADVVVEFLSETAGTAEKYGRDDNGVQGSVYSSRPRCGSGATRCCHRHW